MNPNEDLTNMTLHDEFPRSPARDAVVAVVRGYGAVQRQMEPYFAKFGVTPPQFQMLTVINRLKDQQLTQRYLGCELYVSFPNVTVMLGRLEEAGLVQRQVNPADRRENFVELTPKGRALLRRIWKEHQEQLDRVMAGLTADEQRELARLLNKMLAGVGQPGDRDEAEQQKEAKRKVSTVSHKR